MVDNDDAVQNYKTNNPLATRKEISLYAKNAWAERKYHQLKKGTKIG
jgi:hypothetical protein